MKSYQAVLEEKAAQHTSATKNSVHRSSLLFATSPLATARPVVVLSNHFKLKRNIEQVGMRVWGFDRQGRRVFADHQLLDSPRVYRYDLVERGADLAHLVSCQVEFYSAANLGMPYPAVIVNHVGAGFHNTVHSFARVLNDVFEDEQINQMHVAEASLDVRVDAAYDTFVSFLTGTHNLTSAKLELEVRLPGGEQHRANVPLDGIRYTSQTVRLSEVFPGRALPFGTTLKVVTPAQPQFFGRMMGGLLRRDDNAFSANHTYYDHGVVPEYLDAPYGYNYYPLIPGFDTKLVFYPIQARSRLELVAEYFGAEGEPLGVGPTYGLSSPDGDAAVVAVAAAAPTGARSYRIVARPRDGSKLPARISHQIVIGKATLPGSINESLEYPQAQNADAPAGRPYLSWIQGVGGARKQTQIGLCCMRSEQDTPNRVDFAVYDETGLVREDHVIVPARGAAFLDSARLLGSVGDGDRYFFLYARCATSRIKMFSVIESLDTGNCSAEHNF